NSKSGPAVESGSELKAGESIDLTLDLTEAYGDLSAGQYKMEFVFVLYSPDHNINYTAPAISCEFSIPDTLAEVPDVTGMDVIEAKEMISDAGFRPVIRNVWSDDIGIDRVVKTSPSSGEKAFTDSDVQIYVSAGPVGTSPSTDPLPENLGLYGEVSNVTNTGCTLTIKSDGSAAAFDVSTGEEFVIGRLDENGIFEQLPFVKEAYWNAIGLTVKTGEGETTAVDINWEPYYGVLPAGMYALQKTVYASTASDGDQASRQITLTFEFEIK
ncbi:MAG: PASTA domain-containing protein, partial [Ruminococcus sp.]|nr:PASTA domain-containing protein [Ruminococcus sp.]